MKNRHLAFLALIGPLGCSNNAGLPAGGDGGGDDDGGVGVGTDGGATEGGAPVQCANYSAAKNAYFGDLHTHTAYSADAYGTGTRNTPADAWAFARGKQLQVAAGAPTPGPLTKIQRQLDFAALTDHSEWLDVTYGCGANAAGPFDPSSPWGATQCAPFLAAANKGVQAIPGAIQTSQMNCGSPNEASGMCLTLAQSAWQSEQAMANAAYMPCTFTSLIGYEWTHSAAGATLHKNVIFGTNHAPSVPFDAQDYATPTALWTALDNWLATDPACKASGACVAVTIPHNTNKSWGGAFAVPTTAAGVEQMRRYQKLVEIHQHKGSSECYFDPDAGASEPACNFEHLRQVVGPKGDGPLNPQNYVRTALEDGIAAYADAGVNPMQLGIVGATDGHNGLPGNIAEDAWNGHFGEGDDTPAQRLASSDKNPGGLTGVWAEQNTRESIFAALSRRETFATSGVFITPRFYQTWSATEFCDAGFPGNIIQAGGVPMGGTMNAAGGSASQGPYLYISAAKDQAELAGVDIVKGTVQNGKVVETVTTIPAPNPGAFCVKWQDRSFDPHAPTFYYVRILQVPTPRWTHYDCKAAPTTPGCEPGGALDVSVQERAWTSPIWSLP